MKNFATTLMVSAFATMVAFGTMTSGVYADDSLHCDDLGANYKQHESFSGTSETFDPGDDNEVSEVFIKKGNNGDNDNGCYGPYTVSGSYEEALNENVNFSFSITFNEDGTVTVTTPEEKGISHVEYTIDDNGTPPIGGPSDPSDDPSDDQGGKYSRMGKDQVCNEDVEVVYDASENGNPRKNIEVTFTYNGETKKATTNDDGRAQVYFNYKGSGTVEATATEGFSNQSVNIDEMEDCETTAATGGQVLGASTTALASTGTFAVALATAFKALTGFVTGAAAYLFAKKGKIQA
jgi:hypothetical protein